MGKLDQAVGAGRERYQVIPRVLVFLRHGAAVLLLKGAPTKRIWPNRYNGVGGHLAAGEDVLTAARRETKEETGLTVTDLQLTAVVTVHAGNPTVGILLFVFTGWSHGRDTVASAEGSLQWVATDDLDRLDLVEDLAWLLPRILDLPPGAPPLFLQYGYDAQDRLVITPAQSG